eukprot:NODE_115_length_2622_cov_78.367936_g111_i0.p1 GENE.NODE_115_length_2622_cov_78.367936_g111_i0~~NODE_115_length_2622_cov_78.367936_g111_i0.p1  ORF type:complete len:772 (+),score=194.61 NODE_115_length_2622_cov_78.367936_g111_i0:138-2453(+)
METGTEANVAVVIRVRPLNPTIGETEQAWDITDETVVDRNDPSTKFAFDHVFGTECNTRDVYTHCVEREMVGQCLEGYNGTVCAYGQTGSGKSFTMLGDERGIAPGLVPMAAQDLFRKVSEDYNRDYLLVMSILEIYKEQLYDLLADPEEGPGGVKGNKLLQMRYLPSRGGHKLEGCVKKVVTSANEMVTIVTTTLDERRITGATDMNKNSSRSHCIVRLEVESWEKGQETTVGFDPLSKRKEDLQIDDEGFVRKPNAAHRTQCTSLTSHLNLVDLAGSERIGKSNSKGTRKEEGAQINLGLLWLKNVIQQLTTKDKSGGERFVAYRNSCLTKFLQPALGGNSCTAIVCTISPAIEQMEESLSTLRFAKDAKSIKMKVFKNEVGNDKSQIAKLQKDVLELQKQIKLHRFVSLLKDAAHTKQTKDLHHEAKELRLQLQQQQYKNEDLEGGRKVDAIQASGSVSSADKSLIGEQQAKIEELHKELFEQAADLAEANEILTVLERENGEMEDRIAKLEAEAAGMRAHEDTLRQDVTGMENELSSVIEALDKADRRIEQLTQELAVRDGQMGTLDSIMRMGAALRQNRDALERTCSVDIQGELDAVNANKEDATLLATTVSILNKLVHWATSGDGGTQPALGRTPAPRTAFTVDGGDGAIQVAVRGLDAPPPQAAGEDQLQYLKRRCNTLEDLVRQRDAMRDIVIDTKLKRMQDLVVRVHKSNLQFQAVAKKALSDLKQVTLWIANNKKTPCGKAPEEFKVPPPEWEVLVQQARP